MSFILEALKKSDKKRQEGTVPRLETVHRFASPVGGRRSKWVWLLFLVLLLNAGVFLWLFGPWQRQERSIPIETSTAKVVQQPSTISKPSATHQAGPAPLEMPAPPPVPLASPPAATVIPDQLEPAMPAEAVPPAEVPKTDRKDQINSLADLPPAVRKDIPEMHMSLHAFNKDSAAASMVRINDQILREGAMLAGKYHLEKITAEGAVFRYQGYRFLVPRKGRAE